MSEVVKSVDAPAGTDLPSEIHFSDFRPGHHVLVVGKGSDEVAVNIMNDMVRRHVFQEDEVLRDASFHVFSKSAESKVASAVWHGAPITYVLDHLDSERDSDCEPAVMWLEGLDSDSETNSAASILKKATSRNVTVIATAESMDVCPGALKQFDFIVGAAYTIVLDFCNEDVLVRPLFRAVPSMMPDSRNWRQAVTDSVERYAPFALLAVATGITAFVAGRALRSNIRKVWRV